MADDKKTKPEDRTGKGGGQYNNTNAEKWTEENAKEFGKDLLEWFAKEEYNIFFKEFLLQNDLYADVVTYLCKKFPSFSELIKIAKEWQELRLWKWGTLGKLDRTMAIFSLKNHHGARDEYGLRHTANLSIGEMEESELDVQIAEQLDVLGIEAGEALKMLEKPSNGQTEDGEVEVVG